MKVIRAGPGQERLLGGSHGLSQLNTQKSIKAEQRFPVEIDFGCPRCSVFLKRDLGGMTSWKNPNVAQGPIARENLKEVLLEKLIAIANSFHRHRKNCNIGRWEVCTGSAISSCAWRWGWTLLSNCMPRLSSFNRRSANSALTVVWGGKVHVGEVDGRVKLGLNGLHIRRVPASDDRKHRAIRGRCPSNLVQGAPAVGAGCPHCWCSRWHQGSGAHWHQRRTLGGQRKPRCLWLNIVTP